MADAGVIEQCGGPHHLRLAPSSPTTSKDVYDGSWDWERIYRHCHGAHEIADELERILGLDRDRVVFAGFPAVAADLVLTRPLFFVDRSEYVITAAGIRFESLTDLIADDVLHLLRRHNARHVVISGRLSAFWGDQESFDRLRDAILAFPRARVVVDFFDAAAVHIGQVLSFGRPPTSGTWRVRDVRREPTTFGPAIYKVAQHVAYTLDQTLSEYDVERSYFLGAEILTWAAKCFPEHDLDIRRPLISGDPSFTLVLRSRTTPSR